MNAPEGRLTRRAVLAGAAGASLAAMASEHCQADASIRDAAPDPPTPAFPAWPVWDAHGHLNTAGDSPGEKMANLLEFADRMGIERLIVYMGYPFLADPSPDELRRQNDQVLEALEHARGRAWGFVYLNPNHPEASLAELDRCVRVGPMIGVKLWVAARCHEQALDPIVRRAAELQAPILQHTWQKVTGNLPGESTAMDLAALAARHPQATFIAAHTGGDWEPAIRALRSATNVVAEISGSDPTAGLVEMAVRELGAGRVIYGSDYAGRSFASQLAKVYGADISDSDKRAILAGNLQRLLQPILAAKGIRG